MKNKSNILFLLVVGGISVIFILAINLVFGKKETLVADQITIKTVQSQIITDGKIASSREANLHFQIGGKLAHLFAKEGDSVYQGQTIASIDTFAIQRQLTTALNNYRSTRDTFDQIAQNTTNGVSVGQQRYGLEVTNKLNLSGQNEIDIINGMVKRVADQSQTNLDNAVINVELANYALQLSALTAPFNGVVVHEDVDQAGVNVTPLASYIVIDPNELIFRATINEQDIDYISVGSTATFQLNGDNKKYNGYVSKVYPEKVTLPTGKSIYNVDISSTELKNARYALAGSVQIKSNVKVNTKLVPRWTVLNGQNIWVKEGKDNILKNVTVGKTHGDFIEIIRGLDSQDEVILNPQSIIQDKYRII